MRTADTSPPATSDAVPIDPVTHGAVREDAIGQARSPPKAGVDRAPVGSSAKVVAHPSLVVAIVADPARFYASPVQLAGDAMLTRSRRLEALCRWLTYEERAYRSDRRWVHLPRIRELHDTIRMVETGDLPEAEEAGP